MAYVPLNSVVAVQSNPSVLQALVTVANFPTNPSVSGTVAISNFPTTQNVSGSVVATQGTNPWIVTSSIAGGIFPISGSVAANITNTNVNISGSVVAFQGTSPWVSAGNVAAGVVDAGNPIKVGGKYNSSTVTLLDLQRGDLQLDVNGNTKIAGTVTVTALQGHSVSGTVAVTQGTSPWLVASSIAGGIFPISGSVAANITNTNVNVSGSVVAFVSGTPNVNTAGSVVAFQGTAPWVVGSIVGTYAEDTGHTTADKGLFILGVRNDATASFVSANLEYTPMAVDSAGRSIVKPFSPEDGTIISYNGSVVSASVTLIQASAIGLRNYITDFWITNTGSVFSQVTFQGGDTSIVGFAPAPAGGGISSPGIAIPLKSNTSQDLAFKATGTTSVLYVTVKGYQAP